MPTSWKHRHGCEITQTRLFATESTLTYSGGNELQQSAIEFDENEDLVAGFERLAQRHHAPDYVAAEEAEIMLRKNYAATGSFIAEDRPRALDILGFASQLVFNTFYNSRLCEWEHSGDIDFAVGTARAHNRGISEFCSVDRRLLSTLYVPLADLERAPALAEEAIEMGAGALLIASACPPGHSPSHIGLDPVWSMAADAGVPIVFHVGGTGRSRPELLQRVAGADFRGERGTGRSITWRSGATSTNPRNNDFDGVFERFPDLRWAWLSGNHFDAVVDAARWSRDRRFRAHEERLQNCRFARANMCVGR